MFFFLIHYPVYSKTFWTVTLSSPIRCKDVKQDLWWVCWSRANTPRVTLKHALLIWPRSTVCTQDFDLEVMVRSSDDGASVCKNKQPNPPEGSTCSRFPADGVYSSTTSSVTLTIFLVFGKWNSPTKTEEWSSACDVEVLLQARLRGNALTFSSLFEATGLTNSLSDRGQESRPSAPRSVQVTRELISDMWKSFYS